MQKNRDIIAVLTNPSDVAGGTSSDSCCAARITRRDFLTWSTRSAAALVVSHGLAACDSGDNIEHEPGAVFTHGVASGDPLTDSIILWTRAVPIQRGIATVFWEVATDTGFTVPVHSGSSDVDSSTDYTLKVDVKNLLAGTDYYYRFRSGSAVSVIGRLRTLPVGSVDKVKFAVVSCSNYTAGFFHAYGEAAKELDLDAVLHLGDYIYENGPGIPANEVRALAEDNNFESLSLDDYRKRYQLYRSDPDLMTLHAANSFITVWDDHEIANNSWREGAENHNEGEGDFDTRKRNALRAYFEWMPIRPASEGDLETIYRQFQFGSLVNLMMLDTRLIGRDEQLDIQNYVDPSTGTLNEVEFKADVNDPNRSILGAEQLSWVKTKISASNSTWQVLGQQVLMGRMNLPEELVSAAMANNSTAIGLAARINEIAGIKSRALQGDSTLTEAELQRLNSIPYNLDAWDGYTAERESLLETLRSLDKSLIVITGDTHNAWANDIKDIQGRSVGVEFATPSVTSPGLESVLPGQALATQAENLLALLIDDLQYVNIAQRGFMTLTLTSTEAKAEWKFVNTVKSLAYTVDISRGKSLSTRPGIENRVLL